MIVFKEKALLVEHLSVLWNQKKTIGFVPTMGALHNGHLSLIEKSYNENNYTVVSIFVNPTQFNNLEDLEKYPRTLDSDVEKISSNFLNCIVFAPGVEDIYQGKTNASQFEYDGIENEMEGKHRPGHFDGVGTIVKKLFEIIKPNKAYFGEKDFQQLQIVKKLVQNNNLAVAIIGCDIYREENGLAMSSRNERLSTSSRNHAAIIYNILKQTKTMFASKSVKEINQWVVNKLKNDPLITLEYFEIANDASLKSCVRKSKTKKYRAFIAVFIDNIRLIDNISLN